MWHFRSTEMVEKEHNYPKTSSTEMKKVNNAVVGDSKKQTTYNGPHLNGGKGTVYNQAKITNGFMTQDSRPGHKQQGNIEDNATNK